MDLRAIIHNDSSKPPKEHISHGSPRRQLLHDPPASYGSASPYDGGYHGRPAPPPLQSLTHHDSRSPATSSSYHSLQSPYQHTPSSSSTASGAQYPFPQHTPTQSQTQHQQAYPPRDPYASAPPPGRASRPHYGQPSTSPYTPSASSPGPSYHYGYSHPPHSSHSSPGPSPAQNHPQQIYRESPSSTGSHSHAQQQYYPPQHSQPGTPLGPPTYSRSSIGPPREPPSPYGHHRTRSNESYGGPPHIQATSPTPPVSGSMARELGRNGPEAEQPNGDRGLQVRSHHDEGSRDRSMSVSPKTRLPNQTSHGAFAGTPPDKPSSRDRIMIDTQLPRASNTTDQPTNHVAPSSSPLAHVPAASGREILSQHRHMSDHSPPASRAQHHGLSTTSIDSASSATTNTAARDSRPGSSGQTLSSSVPADMGQEPSASVRSRDDRPDSGRRTSMDNTVEISRSHSISHSTAGRRDGSESAPKHEPVGSSTSPVNTSATPPRPPARKRPRDEPPIFAQSVKRNKSGSPAIGLVRKPTTPTSGLHVKQESKDPKYVANPSRSPDVNGERNGIPPSSMAMDETGSAPQAAVADDGPHGPWEPTFTFTNTILSEEITRVVMDFLFFEVVQRKDVDAGSSGAQLEIEAKLGQLIDKETNERLRIPVLTECVFGKDDPSHRTVFRSSMTESQHRSLNQYLNKAVANSRAAPPPPPAKPRIPMDYVHTHERDRFYELPQAALASLPPSVRPHINPRHKVKVRVTTNQKTGQQLAKIIKVRIADLDIYSPRTAFDWRVSVNLEMPYDGDVDGLVEVSEDGKRPDRNKDRMSYRHLAYQIDLTQVTLQSDSKVEKEHELEIEVSAEKLREQGLLAQSGQATQYENLVKGFVDNVRDLARAVPLR